MSAAEAVEGKTAITSDLPEWTGATGSPTLVGRSESGYYGVQRGQAHSQQNEEAGDELEHTRSVPVQERRVVDVLSQKDCLWLGPPMNHRPVRERSRSTTRVSDRSEASVPVLSGPHSFRPWANCDAFYNPTTYQTDTGSSRQRDRTGKT